VTDVGRCEAAKPKIAGVDRGNPAQGAKGRTATSSLLFFGLHSVACRWDSPRVFFPQLVLAIAQVYFGSTQGMTGDAAIRI
jgi:hypothetical protein